MTQRERQAKIKEAIKITSDSFPFHKTYLEDGYIEAPYFEAVDISKKTGLQIIPKRPFNSIESQIWALDHKGRLIMM
jgi:hypothetical protein